MDESASAVTLSSSVTELQGVGAARARVLKRMGIESVHDLLRHFPQRYEREQGEGTIRDLPMNALGSARGTLVAVRWVGAPRSSKGRLEATLQDHSATLSLVFFNAPWLREKLRPGMAIRVLGKTVAFNGYPQMVSPRWEPLQPAQDAPALTQRLRPIYPAAEDISSAVIEQLVAQALPAVTANMVEPLPSEHLSARHMPVMAEAYRMIHQPRSEEDHLSARRRLAYNELLLLQLGIRIKRHYNRTALRASPLRWSQALDQHIRERFPFQLTQAQDRVVKDIAADLQRDEPMNRLLQGDVGSGKTIVALYALLLAVANRKQAALMAPTELLATQHALSIGQWLAGSEVRIEVLTAGQSGPQSARRREQLHRIESGEADLVIGTQALLTESVRFSDLALVVVDEQHRFGVLQRANFRDKQHPETEAAQAAGQRPGVRHSPHYLVMTATPIPRTLSLTVFGDLDISTIDALPPGRQPIITRVVGMEKSDEVYQYLAGRVQQGEQLYVVVPLIESSEKAAGKAEAGRPALASVEEQVTRLSGRFFPAEQIAAVHGRLRPEERDSVMQRFRRGEVRVLVATTVIEVGVDVPQATLMVVEHAERFGLAQLHQLRGRVGRGGSARQSLCVFIAEPGTEESQKRMQAIAASTNGFEIAEKDLEIRGMGELFGTRQHGSPPLRIADLPRDLPLLQMAQRDADALTAADPTLTQPEHDLLRKALLQTHGQTLELVDVG